MNEAEILRQELDHYRTEKERIRKVIGQIGGATSKRQDRLINIIFLVVVLGLFAFDIVREITGFALPTIPRFLSMELALLLVSLKIIWMIHRQSKVDHFQFWVLNSIEFQINTMSKRLKELEERIQGKSE
ncbi:MAG: hypothetical protein JSV89_10230 [Spirochaetaceae bacterium]|nr:MAG: hypothetical protein JSV89_10230 [Spirochaetaceae bacterium]